MKIEIIESKTLGLETEPLTNKEVVEHMSVFFGKEVKVEQLGTNMILSRGLKLQFPNETKHMFYDFKKLFYTYNQEEINLVLDKLYEYTNEIYVISMVEWELLGKLKPMIFKWAMSRGGMSKLKGLTFKFANWNNYKKWETLTF